MDSLGGGIANADLSKLSDRDKQELQQFAMNEGQKARIQSCMAFLSIHTPFPLLHHSSLHLITPLCRLPLFYTRSSRARTKCNHWLTYCVIEYSDTLPNRHMFPQMYPRGYRQSGQIG